MICSKAQNIIIRMQKRGITPKQKAALRYALRRHAILGKCKSCSDVYRNIRRRRRIAKTKTVL